MLGDNIVEQARCASVNISLLPGKYQLEKLLRKIEFLKLYVHNFNCCMT